MKSGRIEFPDLSPELRRRRLTPPTGRIRAVLDTDTFNEIDDQFAVAYAMLSPEKIDLRAITAAPFFNNRSSGPADGMEKSYEEIGRLLALIGAPAGQFAFRGATTYLPNRNTPVDSPAARRIIELAHEARRAGETLYVPAIAAITNVASALLLDPSIAGDITVVWLGGQPFYWENNREFNLSQDVPAAQVIFDSGVPLVFIPCASVAELLMVTIPELDARCGNCGPLGDFLYHRTRDYMLEAGCDSKVIWDIATIGWFLQPDAFSTAPVPAPRLRNDGSWGNARGRHELLLVRHIRRDLIFRDLFNRLQNFGKR